MTPEQAIVPPFLRRVVIHDYKSIEVCDVKLGPRTILIGRNGAGKSNFLDALHFVADALQTSLDQAISKRGGIELIRRQAPGRNRIFSIRLEFGLPYHQHGVYAIEVVAGPGESFTLLDERLDVCDSSGRMRSSFHREGDQVTSMKASDGQLPLMPPVLRDRLYLVNAAGLPDFKGAYDALTSMGFYKLNPDAMRTIPLMAADEVLRSDGSNIAGVVGRLEARDPKAFARINDYLTSIVPEIKHFGRVSLGPGEALAFQQQTEGSDAPRTFYAASMSDGTLRAVGVFVAAAQIGRNDLPLRLIGIEEPETALHPAAAGALMDVLGENSEHTQAVLTTHSADLLDMVDLTIDALLVVSLKDGVSQITTANPASLEAIKRQLYTAGELLRMDQFETNEADYGRQALAAEHS